MTITQPPNILFPDSETRRSLTDLMDRRLEQARQDIKAGPVVTRSDLSEFRAELKSMDFNSALSIEGVSEWTISNLQTGMVHMTHPGYMGLFNPAPNFPSEYADRIAAMFNPQLCVWSHAPIAVEIEEHVIKQFAKRVGLPKTSIGHFTSGGSEANATAFLCALTRAEPNFAVDGVYAFSGKPRVYVSAESHLAWLKIAHQNGIGRNAVRLIATDGIGRMNFKALEEQIIADKKAGDHPVFIAATAGTTNAGMVDPLTECSIIAKDNNLWLHVDAAWGGALIVSEREKHVLAGIELADSVTIDAHKWFATTMGTGMFLTQHKKILSETFRVSASYMPSNDSDIDLYVNSMLWSRRFLGLRLFLALACVGWSGYAKHIEHSIDLIDYFNKKMTKHGWKVMNETRMAISCLQPPEGSQTPEYIVDKVVSKGQEWISVAKLEGQSVLRICITNGMTSTTHIDRLVKHLLSIVKINHSDD